MEKKKTTNTKKKTTKKAPAKTKSKIVVEKKKGFSSLETVIIAFFTLVIGLVLGLAISLSAGKYSAKKSVVEEAYNKLLNGTYYNNVTEESLTDAAIDGMVRVIDNNSSYIKDVEYIDNINGYYNGLGITIGRQDDGLVYVVEVNPEGPSKDLIQVNDQIISFNDWVLDDYVVSDLSAKVKALPVNTKIKVSLIRNGESLEYIIPTKMVTIKTVSDYHIIGEDYGYLKIDYISTNTYTQVKEALEEFNKNNVKAILLDLRCNTGGDVNSLKNIASLFLNNNSVIYKEFVNKEIRDIYSEGEPLYKGKIVVLVNETTASAAEMLAATLKDNLGAKLVGAHTYGKYTLQTTYTLSNNSIIKYTIGEWLRSNGSSVRDNGLIPDVSVENDDIDNQYNEAIKELTKD